MKIDVKQVFENPGEVFEFGFSGPFKSLTFQGQRFEFPGGAEVKGSYFGDEDGITVTGSFWADTSVSCSRCLEEFDYTVEFDFTEYYKENPDDDTQYEFIGDTIELGKMLADNLVLSLPTRFLCDEQCKGLCQKCGKDLNKEDCGCADLPDESNPFYGLKDFIDD